MHFSHAADATKSGNTRAYVVLVTGPAGAGKSAAADLWASQRATPTSHIALDDVRHLVKAGYADPVNGWNETVAGQLELARRGCVALARLATETGHACVVDDVIFPQWEAAGYERWQRALGDLPHALIVLLPSYTVVCARNALRQGDRRLPDAMLRTIYEMMLHWRRQSRFPVLDNSAWSIDETAERLQEAVRALGFA